MDWRRVRLPGGEAPRAGPLGRMVAETVILLGDNCMRSQGSRDRVADGRWRECLRAICDEAHARGVSPEQLLRELKDAIRYVCDARAVAHGPARTEFTNYIVSMCIEEFYA